MKIIVVLFSLFALISMNMVRASAQERFRISVRGGQLNSGVIIPDIAKAGKTFQLHCNQGASDCTTLKTGNCQMLELPDNFGMYEYKDVEVYPESAAITSVGGRDNSQKLGEYCLVKKVTCGVDEYGQAYDQICTTPAA